MRAFVLTSVLLVSFAAVARAQSDDPWLIVPTVSDDDSRWIQAAAESVRNELVARQIEVWPFESAAARFEAEASAPAAKVTDDEIQRWVERSSAAIRSLAEGDYDTALQMLNEAQRLSRAAAEELNREQERSRTVLDTCLYMVRALLETESESRAQTMAQECRRLVPRGEPTAVMHSRAVMRLLKGVDASRAAQTGSIRVTSQPSGCAVRVNGVSLGETPFEMGRLFPGLYRVQVECDPESRGRVHRANVVAGPTDLFVDLRFDRAVETVPLLHLRYESAAERDEDRPEDLAAIAKVVPASALLTMAVPEPDTLELELMRGALWATSAIARVPVGPDGPSPGDLALAARTLVAGKCTDFIGPEPAELPCGEPVIEAVEQAPPEPPEKPWPAHRRPRGQFISGLALAGLGSAALVSGYALLAPRASAAEDWVSGLDATGVSDSSAHQRWLRLGNGIIVTSAVGGAALVAAMPLALPNREKTPWWAWLSGGLGVAAVAASGYLAATIGNEPASDVSCTRTSIDGVDARACVSRAERRDLAILAGVTAAPLLTIPIVYLVRPTERRVSPQVEVAHGRAVVSVRGTF